MAVHILIQEAGSILEMYSVTADFGDFYDTLFDDVHFEFLYAGAFDGFDGIENTEMATEMGIVHLDFESWFERIGPSESSG